MREYLSIDRQQDLLASLDTFTSSMERIPNSELAWKFALISMHSALQGAMCIALRNGNSFQTWKDHQFKKWYEAYNSGKEGVDMPATPQLDFFMELFDKCFKDCSSEVRDTISWLNDTRNNFVHFNTDSYSIHLKSVIKSCSVALDCISKTPDLAQGIFFYDEDQTSQFKSKIKEANDQLRKQA